MADPADTSRAQSNLIRLGTIAEVDTTAKRCRVSCGDIQTDWLPWFVPYAGNRIAWSAPSVDEQVVVLSADGETVGGVVLRGLYSDQFDPPDTAANKHYHCFVDGAVIEYDDAAHALKATLPGDGTAAITAEGGVTINGPLTVNGETQLNGHAHCSDTVTASTDVVGGGKSLKGHKHTGVQTGGGVSGPPQ